MLLGMVKTTILMVMKAGTDDPRLSYAGAIMGRGRGSPPYPVKGAIPFPGTFYGVLVKRLRHRPFKPGTRVRPPYTLPLAGLVEWQTQRIQNPPPLAYGFKSHTRHHLGTLNSCYGF